MSKKNITIGIVVILIAVIVISVVFTNKKISLSSAERSNTNQHEAANLKEKKGIDPISKENALKVLKATYGDGVSNTEDDLKQAGNDYVVEVKVYIEDEEDHDHVHDQTIGTHKIDIYTGEIKDIKEK